MTPLIALATLVLALGFGLPATANAAPLTGSSYDSGDGNQDDSSAGADDDWQGAYGDGRVDVNADAVSPDNCFSGGTKENTPNDWAFTPSSPSCTPGKSNLIVGFTNPEATAATAFFHGAFQRESTSGNTFLAFELNRNPATWTNGTGTTIPCRESGDILISYEVGGSTLTTVVYKWVGDGTGPAACPNGANGSFTAVATSAANSQATINSTADITNYVDPGAWGTTFLANSFGEAAIDLPTALGTAGESTCFSFVQMQVHTRSSSSISSALIDYLAPVPMQLHSCSVQGLVYEDVDADGTQDAGESGLAGHTVYVDYDEDGVLDAGEPTATTDVNGEYGISPVTAGDADIRVVPAGTYTCTGPSPCKYDRTLAATGNSLGNDFGLEDPAPALSIDDVTVAEGDSGTTNATFTVSMDKTSSSDVSFDYATSDGSATQPADYIQSSGNDATISAGSTSTTITVPVKGDTLDEPDETFDVNASDVQGASVADGTGIATVTDDDPAPTLSIDDMTVTEGDSGTTNASFTVSLSAASGKAVSFDFATSDGSAAQPADYTSSSGNDTTISAGSTSTTITVPVLGDTLDELNETFDVSLTDPTNATISDSTGTGTITDDDTASLSIDDISVTEGDTGTTNATFTVSLSTASDRDVSFDWATVDGSASQPADYTQSSGNDVTISAGSTSTTISVPVKGDTLDEPDETFDVNASDVQGASVADGTGIATVTDDDPAPSLSIDDVSVTEGDSGTTNATFTVRLSAASGKAVSFDFATSDGSAAQPADYTQSSGNDVTISAGSTSTTITVPVVGDTLDELDETFDVTLTDPTNATIADGTGTATITDDDTASLSIDDVSVTEGDSGTTDATFTVSLSTASDRSVTFDWATSDDTATQPADYTQSSGDDVTISAGSTSTTISVPVKGDTLDEPDESFDVSISDIQNASVADGTGVGTITDDDPAPTLSINDVSVTEGDSGTANATFTVSLSAASGKAVSFDYATSDGTATQPGDYTSSSGNDITISAGSTSTTISVPVVGDTLEEGNETFDITLTDPTNATIADGTGVGTITDDESLTLSIDDVTVTEGDSGTTNATFTVSLSTSSASDVTFDYATSDDSATEPGDYTQSSGNDTTISAGSTSTTITVPVKGDTIDELDETYDVTLTDPANATIADGTGVGTITDDDTASLSIDDVTVAEGNLGPTNATFTVSASTTSDRAVSFDFATSDDSATQPADYTQSSGNDVTISAGDTTATVTIAVNGDTLDEIDETYDVTLSDAQNATIADGIGVGTITDDDPAPTLSIDDMTVTEGDSGTTNASFTVSLSAASGKAVSFDFATSDGSATQPGDYTASSGNDTTISAGSTSTTISVPVKGDTLDEPDETFDVTLTDPTNATIADGTGVGTITDDDTASLSIDDVTVTEGDSGTTNATFTVSMDKTSSSEVTFDYASSDDSATQPGDYTQSSGNDTTISAGSTSTTITVPVLGDTLDELDETFDVSLTDPTNATIADGTGVGTIADDDPAPQLSIDDVTVTEGDSGTTNASFTVSLSAASGKAVSFDYATSDGTATQPADYTQSSGNDITISAGSTSTTITVPVKGDTIDELNETFDVSLTDPTNTTISDGTGTTTINDDDTASLSINDVSVTEGDSGTTDATFTVSLSTASDRDVSFDFATSDDSATEPDDYTSASGNDVTISAGSTSTTITVTVKGDTIEEGDESFDVSVSDVQNASVADGTGVGTITDDDAVTLSIDDVTVTEGDSGTTDATFTVSLSTGSASDVTFDWATSDDTATQPADYTSASGNDTTISAGSTSTTITVPVKGDTIDELNETFDVTLTDTTNATIADGTGVGTITDDDPAPTLSIDDVTVAEGHFGPTNAIFTISMDRASASDVSFDYSTSDGTATQPADYTQSSGNDVTISAGSTSTTITVPVVGDTLDELDETFDVTLTDPTNASVTDGTGTATITDDDSEPSISIDDITVSEGVSGTTDATFTVSLSSASGKDVTFDFATADGSATEPGDYAQKTGNDVTISAGATTATITISVKGDTIDELDEAFTVALSDVTNAAVGDATGTATIADDDTASLSIDDVTVTEGDSGTTGATFTVGLSTASDRDVSFDYATSDDSATEPADYASASGADETISAGSTSTTISVPVKGDTIDELDETFDVTLTDPTNATIADGIGVGTITDDDTASLSIDDITVSEGSSGITDATFTVSLDKASDRDVTFDFATANGSAAKPDDYVEKTGADVTISAGETTATVTISVKGDELDELDETFEVALSDVQNASIGKGTGTATITDDDTATLSIDDITVSEGDSGTTDATFTVSLSTASDRDVSFDWASGDNTATAPADYVAGSGNDVTISAGSTSTTITVRVKGDILDELDETFGVTLSDVQNASLGKATGTATVTDDEGISISVDDITVTEGGKATFTITLDKPAAKTVTVIYETRNGGATQPDDYARKVGTVSFAPGETTKTVAIDTVGDQLDEPDEKFTLKLSAPTNASLGDGTGAATITDDDAAPVLSVGDITVTEGGEGCFELRLDGPSGRAVQVSYATSDASATELEDYDHKAGTVTFAPGETTKAVCLGTADDSLDEPDESFTLELFDVSNATLSDGVAEATITDDDEEEVTDRTSTRPLDPSEIPAGCPVPYAGADMAIAGGAGAQNIEGSPGQDILRSYDGPDQLVGRLDNDCLIGDGGPDRLRGKKGADWQTGGRGRDMVQGDAGNDWLSGGGGLDRVKGAKGEDKVFGNAGNDNVSAGDGADLLKGGPGDDRMFANNGDDRILGGPGNDVIFAGPGNDRAKCGPGNDKVVFLRKGRRDRAADDCERVIKRGKRRGKRSSSAGGGGERATSSSGPAPAAEAAESEPLSEIGLDDVPEACPLSIETATLALAGTSGSAKLAGGHGDDILLAFANQVLAGGEGGDCLVGGAGLESLRGGKGPDWVLGGDGDDELRGGPGNDELVVGGGKNVIDCGPGEDRVIVLRRDHDEVANDCEIVIVGGEGTASASEAADGRGNG